jgi:hypothetical protein
MHRFRLLPLAAAVALAAVLALSPAVSGAHSAPARAATTHLAGAKRPVVAHLARAATHEASLLAVPKFIFHAGLAFGAFHHFIYLPFKAGKFTSGSIFSKLKNYLEAGAAALFVYHETKLALADAQQNKVLKLLVSPITAVVAVFATIVAKVKGHSLDAATVTSAETQVGSIESLSAKNGSSITEALPTVSQLAAGSA